MAQIYERKNRGFDLGQTFATGISSGVQALLDHKMQQMHQQRQGDVFEKLGFPRELAAAPPHIQQQFAKTMAQGPANEAFASQVENARAGKPISYQGLNQQQIAEITRAASARDKAEAQRENNRIKEKNVLTREDYNNARINAPFNNKLDTEVTNAPRQLEIVKELGDLIRNGEVATGFSQELWPSWYQSDDSQLARKLIGELAAYADATTDLQLKEQLKGLPDLAAQSGTGILSILPSVMARFSQPLVYDKARQEVLEEHGGKQPKNLASLVAKKARPELEKLYNEVKYTPGAKIKSLPDPKTFPPDKVLVRGNDRIRAVNGKWVRAEQPSQIEGI